MTPEDTLKNAVNNEQDRPPTKILNPFYDPVCKLLLRDQDCARLFLSKLLKEKIVKLTLLAEEVPIKIKPSKKAQTSLGIAKTQRAKDQPHTVLRLDFKATIITRQKRTKIVLIEVQKVLTSADIPRFRAYLGAQYLNKEYSKLPLIAIYLLGTKLPESYTQPNLQAPIIHGQIQFYNTLSERKIRAKSPFANRLTHKIYILQLPYLSPNPSSELEKALLIFNPHYVAPNPHFLTLQEDDLKGEYVILWRCLAKAAAEPEIEKAMQAVDEYIETFDTYADEIIKYRKLAKANEAKAKAAEKYRIESEVYRAENQVYRAESEAYKQRIKELEELLQKANSQKSK